MSLSYTMLLGESSMMTLKYSMDISVPIQKNMLKISRKCITMTRMEPSIANSGALLWVF